MHATPRPPDASRWRRPAVTLAAPSGVEQGRTLALTITGTNVFMSGATMQFGNAGITVNSVTAGAADSHVHTGLTNGTTCNYNPFAGEASGNVSTALLSEVSGFFNSCETSAAKLSIASIRS